MHKLFPTSLASLLLLLALLNFSEANLRCYSCAPCNELEYFAGDLHHFEADCYIDRYCMKISGRTRDIFGYVHEVNIRGCPWVSILATMEEGCTESSLSIAGAGLVEGTFCLCKGHLCNGGVSLAIERKTLMLTTMFGVMFYLRMFNTFM